MGVKWVSEGLAWRLNGLKHLFLGCATENTKPASMASSLVSIIPFVIKIWAAETEGAKFWRNILTELRNRGVMDDADQKLEIGVEAVPHHV